MTSLTGDEPDLELGASGEGVMLLQVRLYALGIYRQIPDGTYNMVTENAVRELQSAVGHDNNGEVTRDTWEALVHQEIQAGILYRYLSPYDALTQIRYDAENPVVDQTISEDGQWRWDGYEWQPVDGSGGYGWADGAGDAGYGAVDDEYAGLLSPDGQWRWDGAQWQPTTGEAGTSEPASGEAVSDEYNGMLSEDGQWRWTGTQWEPA